MCLFVKTIYYNDKLKKLKHQGQLRLLRACPIPDHTLIGVISQQDAGHTAPWKLINSRQHWLEEETQRTGPPHCWSDIMVRPAVPSTPTTPRGASSGRREAVAACPARTVAVVAIRANPPDTTGKLTENTIMNFHSNLWQNYVFSTEEKYFICWSLK